MRGDTAIRQTRLQTSRARDLRQRQTDAEKLLWQTLRGRRFLGLKFRRQVPLGPYVVDFCCSELNLIIEVDGCQHAESPSDARRDADLTAGGYNILRFWNSDILTNLPGVLQRIADEVQS